jgi:hypothetical protein
MSSRRTDRPRAHIQCERLEERETPSAAWVTESFDQTALGGLPANWQQWSSAGGPAFNVQNTRSYSAPAALTTTAASSVGARAWYGDVMPADFGASAYVYLDSLQPLQLLARGRDLTTATPTFYALSVTRGLQATLVKVVGGTTTTLGTVKSTAYVSGQWVRVAFTPSGSQVTAEIYRPDTGQYLNAAGQWQAAPTTAIQVSDSSIAGDGYVGVSRPAAYSGTVTLDDFSVLGVGVREHFDTTAAGALPAGWAQWANATAAALRVSAATAFSPANGLASSGGASTAIARAWVATPAPDNVQASADVLLTGLEPARVFARGANLATATPTYYALSIARGLEVELLRVVNGATSELGTLRSATYLSSQWVKVTLTVTDDRIQALVYREDTGQYLNATGQWQNGLARALDVTDGAIAGNGFAGVERPALYAGTVTLDDFEMQPSTGDTNPPAVAITAPATGTTVSDTLLIQATATDNIGVEHVEFLVDGQLRYATTRPPYAYSLDTFGLANGGHTITVRAYDLAGNVGQASVNVTVQNAVVPLPAIPSHYTHIRIAELAYTGTPFTTVEQNLLRNSVDLVVPNPSYLSQINAVAPNTPQLIYTNVSNLYENLLTDWLIYADQHGYSREDAFYHAAQATPWTGNSASALPVNDFWSVLEGANVSALTNLTSASRNTTTNDVPFGGVGTSMYIGFPETFRELNVNVSRAAAGGWAGVLEYATAVDASGTPTAWKTLTLLSDTTAGFTKSGTILFDPPADWKTGKLGAAAPLYYIRVRTTAGGTAPIATTLLGRDYVQAHGTTSGVTPAFDPAADTNHDGYLNDAEYANRAAGKDARFVYESRLFYPYYGQMRFVTNPANADLRAWAADYHVRFLAANPLADGLFVDNSGGRSPLAGIATLESTANYSQDYGAMLGAINRAIAPKWVMANTAGGGVETDAVIRNTPATAQEFALRPLDSSRVAFEDEATLIAHRQALTSPSDYMILDSLPTGGSPTDARTQLATLAEYYMVGDPNKTFLMFYGGYDPNSSWTQHWSPAAAYDVGAPQGSFSIFAQGSDPANSALTYNVYQRSYGNALVLYKPLSYKAGVGTGTLSDATATTHALGGTYRILHADGTLSGPVTQVTLRNGEGAILIKA